MVKYGLLVLTKEPVGTIDLRIQDIGHLFYIYFPYLLPVLIINFVWLSMRTKHCASVQDYSKYIIKFINSRTHSVIYLQSNENREIFMISDKNRFMDKNIHLKKSH
ncbi:hypothetical protein V1477_002138 [Vespula maculifrons]|uniref:Uncharacterized protein n=1 Tax=Vespula maculifrons TaxID=7453 RepID=A0ABD2CVM8_VESMC